MFAIRACDETFLDTNIVELATNCCADAKGLKPPDTETLARMRAMQKIDPDILSLAFHQKTAVGMCALELPDKGNVGCLQFLGVCPEWRRRGIGRALEVQAVAIAQRHGGILIRTRDVLDSQNEAGICFLERAGWKSTLRGGIRMWRDLENLPPVELPEGYTIRSYQSGDDADFVRIKNAAFPGWQDWNLEDFKKEFLESPYFHPERVFFAVYAGDGELVGTATAWTRIHEEREIGNLHWVAVIPAHRQRGLGKALCLQSLHKMRELGYRETMLGTMESLESAVRLYYQLGFRDLYRHSMVYEKKIG